MISGKIILESSTKVTLDKRFGEIAKQVRPTPTPRIQQQANVIIPYSRQELFGNKRPAALSIAARLKKRSINYRLGLNPNANVNRQYTAAPVKPRVFQRIGLPNRRRGGGQNAGGGANAYLFGGQSGMGIRLRGQGRIGGTRTFRSQTRGYLNNNAISRFSGYSTRGNRNNTIRGRRGAGGVGNNNSNNNKPFVRAGRGRGRGRGGAINTRGRGGRRGNNNNPTNRNVTKESLDSEIDKYMASTKLDNDSVEMNAV